MTKLLLAVGSVFLVAGLAIYIVSCPCERVPGLWLTGSEVETSQQDWSFVNQVGTCELEVRAWRPHSITLNCMADAGELFVSCSRCDGKYWSGVALEHPAGRLRVDRDVYPIMLTRVTLDAELDRAWQARANKLGRDAGARPDHWWSFQLTSRSL